MAQTFSPFRHRHSLLPEAVREAFSNVAILSYVLLECDHGVCFTRSSLDLEKYLVGIYILKYALLLVYKSLDFLSILNIFISLFSFVCVSVCRSSLTLCTSDHSNC